MRRYFLVLIVAFGLGTATAATGAMYLPPELRIPLGILMIIIAPGAALVLAMLQAGKLSFGEMILASVGLSLGISICVAVLLAATPLGLSRETFAVGLGGGTAIVAVFAASRSLWLSRKSKRKVVQT